MRNAIIAAIVSAVIAAAGATAGTLSAVDGQQNERLDNLSRRISKTNKCDVKYTTNYKDLNAICHDSIR